MLTRRCIGGWRAPLRAKPGLGLRKGRSEGYVRSKGGAVHPMGMGGIALCKVVQQEQVSVSLERMMLSVMRRGSVSTHQVMIEVGVHG